MRDIFGYRYERLYFLVYVLEKKKLFIAIFSNLFSDVGREHPSSSAYRSCNEECFQI